jgi:chromosomal replication initiation ATPase DnaA
MISYAVAPGLPRAEKEITPELVIAAACEYFGCSVKQLKQKTNHRKVVEPRQILMYLLRTEAGLSFVRVGSLLGHHYSTVIHTMKVIKDRLSINDELTMVSISSIKTMIRRE